MKCKHRGNAVTDTLARYAAGEDRALPAVLNAFNSKAWRTLHRGSHHMQAYRQMFFKLARERGIHLGS